MINAMNAARTTDGPVVPIPTLIPKPSKYQFASYTGAHALWVVFALMVITSASLAVASWRVPVRRRLLHVAVTLAAIVGALSYFALATGQGTAMRCDGHHHHHHHHGGHHDGHHGGHHDGHHGGHHGHVLGDSQHGGGVCREVFWARYVDWAVSTPLLLLALCAMAGVDGAHTLMAVAADLVMKLAGLFAALGRGHHAQRWGWYAIAWVAYIFVIWHVAVHGSRAVKPRGAGVAKAFGSLALFALVLWTIYPIVWALAGSSRIMSVDWEIFAYAILDVLAKAGFGVWLLVSLRRVPDANVELPGYWSTGLGSEGRIRIGDDDEGA